MSDTKTSQSGQTEYSPNMTYPILTCTQLMGKIHLLGF